MNNDLGNLSLRSFAESYELIESVFSRRYFQQCHGCLQNAASGTSRTTKAAWLRVPAGRASHRQAQLGAEKLSASRRAVSAAHVSLRRQHLNVLFCEFTPNPASLEGSDLRPALLHRLFSSHAACSCAEAGVLPLRQLDRRLPVE